MPESKAKVGAQADPYRNYNFVLEIPDVSNARFTQCHGLGVRVETIRYRESGAGQIVRALPGRVEYNDVVLRYGLTDSRDLWGWLLASATGAVQRKHVSIIMLDLPGSGEAFRWNLLNAWPCQWSGAALDALGREAAIEELHLAYDSIERG